MRGSMDDSGIPKILLSPEQSGIKNAITVSELRRSYRKLCDLSLESGAPVYITRGGDAGGVFFTMVKIAFLMTCLMRRGPILIPDSSWSQADARYVANRLPS